MTDSGFTSSGRARRLYVEAALGPDRLIALSPGQSHYVRNVVRLKPGDEVLVFNGVDGEWRARLELEGRAAGLMVEERVRPQAAPADLDYLFAPLKRARLDYMVQKATELGAARLRPVITERTAVARVNFARMRANAIEAAEQCGLVWVPEVSEPRPLAAVIAEWPADRALVFADEAAEKASPVGALAALRGKPIALIVGPEGGFSSRERALLLAHAATRPISLGPRIMRADTACIAALALIQALAGDWTVAAK